MIEPKALAQRPVGQTGMAVSILGFGTAPLGGLFAASSEDDAGSAIHAAIEGGITHFDTAPSYGFGLAEERLGAALGAARSPDVRAVVSSKAGRLLVENTNEAGAQHWVETNGRATSNDSSRDGILRSVEASLTRTGLTKLDILFLHDPDKQATDDAALETLLAESYSVMDELRQQGVVSAIGIGVNSAAPCLRALDAGAWDCFMLAGTHSVLTQDDGGLLDRCARQRVSVMVAAPFLSGVLAGGDHWRYRPVPDAIRARVALLNNLCREYDIPVEATALQFPLFHPAVCNVVVGMRSAAEVAQNLACLGCPIPRELWQRLQAHGFISDAHFEHITAGAA